MNLNKAELILWDLLKGTGISQKEIKEFQLQGNESRHEIEMHANDFLSDLHTERCEERAMRERGDFDD